MKHNHHIIPKYLGGSDEPSNKIELTPEEHAEAHKKLYEKFGNFQDKQAWFGLAKLASKQEIIQTLCREGGKKGGSSGGKQAVETHKKNKSGLWREDHEIQKLGNAAGCAKGGAAASIICKKLKKGIYSFSKEEKTIYASKGGQATGSKNGKLLKEESRGIFDPEKRKEYSSLGGKIQKGWKKHFHPNGDFKMALPGSEKSKGLLERGYFLK